MLIMYAAHHLTRGMFHKDNSQCLWGISFFVCVLDLTKGKELDIGYHSELIRFVSVLIGECSQTNKDGWRPSW